jgi:ribosomal protein L35AE/L33A
MVLLHIEHATMNFDAWKATFDGYAELRQKSSVRSYRVSRLIDRPDFAMIDLEFDSLKEAQSLLAAVQQLWQRAVGTVINDPQWRISEVVEEKEFAL